MFSVLNLKEENDCKKYSDVIERSGILSAYNKIEYLDVFCGGLENLYCFLYEGENQIIILPAYIKEIKIFNEPKGVYDFYTPYGYTGPFYSENTEEKDLQKFWDLVSEWQKQNNIVSGFVRFNLFNNYKGFPGEVFETMLNIKGAIIEEEEQWSNFEHKVRKNVKRALRENLTSKIYYRDIDETVINEFYDIYIGTMKRTNATDFFFYSLDSFKNFVFNNKELCAICNIYDEDKIISSELLLISHNSLFSFLGGTLDIAFDKRPNDFLKYEVINWARQHNFEFYVLGGGYGYEDGIFKYKKAFFPNDVVNYVTGRVIVNTDLYEELLYETNELRQRNGMEILNAEEETYFPLYNKQN
ncbi:GNAT family N-acetyltransferase [Elizabethkingia anophelis]|uniref:GNAT family N-acetyltransferase n=1 Tax=Elizabethkingia anophelis TaxID=1117645 RepID=UPI000999935C|nr:GNAT family N-acetyltransferase [Elizabethkingia anophelis]MCT4287941.1 GNAT family N-acetyltransferase [Elizabethkingia anophelis]OPC31753.1 hypothetical protein BAX98_06845 [Elizabethkingia anophelis]